MFLNCSYHTINFHLALLLHLNLISRSWSSYCLRGWFACSAGTQIYSRSVGDRWKHSIYQCSFLSLFYSDISGHLSPTYPIFSAERGCFNSAAFNWFLQSTAPPPPTTSPKFHLFSVLFSFASFLSDNLCFLEMNFRRGESSFHCLSWMKQVQFQLTEPQKET